MNKYLKYLKALAYIIIPLLILNILFTIMGYFNILSNSTINISNLAITFVLIFITNIHIGKNTDKKGYLEGLKLGIIITICFLVITLFISNINLKTLIYYLGIIIISITGSMIGISKRKN